MLKSNGFRLIALSGSCSLLAMAGPALAQQTADGANETEQADCSPSAPMAQILGCELRRIWLSS